jgi:hypothetical protein
MQSWVIATNVKNRAPAGQVQREDLGKIIAGAGPMVTRVHSMQGSRIFFPPRWGDRRRGGCLARPGTGGAALEPAQIRLRFPEEFLQVGQGLEQDVQGQEHRLPGMAGLYELPGLFHMHRRVRGLGLVFQVPTPAMLLRHKEFHSIRYLQAKACGY